MKAMIQEVDGEMVATLEGRLDTAAASATESALEPLNDCKGKDIVLDCTALEYISSSGLRIFLGILKKAKTWGGHVFIKGMSDDIRSVFTMTGFIKLFEFR